MSKKIKVNKKIVIIVAIVLALLAIGGCAFMIGKHYVGINGQHLNKYRYSSGGGMTGGYDSETVSRYDDTHALVCLESAQWHYQDPDISEYLVDISIMDELENVVRKERMNFWNDKTFTKMFVADGESYSYSFYFDKAKVSFSSQLYPQRYSKKLHKLDEVMDKYLENGEKLPGLVKLNNNNDDEISLIKEGEFELYVCSYANNYLKVRILNGKDEEVKLSPAHKIIDADTNKTIFEEDKGYTITVYPMAEDETSISLNSRLDVGNYILYIGDIEIPFEIR